VSHVIGIVEVARVAAPGPGQWLATALGAVSGGATIVLVVAIWWRRRQGLRWPWWLAAATTGIDLVARAVVVATSASADTRVLALAGRLGLIAAAAVAARTGAVDARTRTIVSGVLGTFALATVPLALAGSARLGVGALSAIVGVLAVGVWLVTRVEATRAVVAVALAATLALGALGVPSRAPRALDARLVAGSVLLDVTLVPAGREMHVYAWDREGRPAAIADVEVVLPASGWRLPLFEVSPDHHLSYVLELPDQRPLELVLEATTDDGRVTAHWTLEE
jgi:hypothetical protein